MSQVQVQRLQKFADSMQAASKSAALRFGYTRCGLFVGAVVIASLAVMPSVLGVADQFLGNMLLVTGVVASVAMILFAAVQSPSESAGAALAEDDKEGAALEDDHYAGEGNANENWSFERAMVRPRPFVEASETEHYHDRFTSLTTLAVGLGHDLGNNVLPILCHLDSLLSQNLPPRAKQELHAMRKSAMALRRLSSALSLFALDPDDAHATAPATTVHTWWSEVEPIMRRALPAEISFKVDIPSDLPVIKVPPHQLTQAILKLIVNAAEAIDGRGEVQLKCRQAQLGKSVHFSIVDTGRGMTEDVRRQAMHPFFTTKTRGLSTGLGLSQVQGFAENAGGSVDIFSSPGRGTTVVMSLPAIVTEPARARVAQLAIPNERLAAHTRAMLGCFGISEQAHGESNVASLLIIEPVDGFLEVARKFLRGGDRRVIIHGKPPIDVTDRQMFVTDGSHRHLHQALQNVAKETT